MKSKYINLRMNSVAALLLASSLSYGQTLTWDLSGSGDWDTTTTNWTSGGSPTTFASDGTNDVIFNKPEGGIINLVAVMDSKSTTVSATEGIYTFTGAAITGTGSVTKSGDGILVLSSANTYSGATAVNGGILQVSNPNQLGSSTAFTIASGAMIEVTTTGAFPSSDSTLTGAGTLKISGVGGLRFNMSDFTGVVEASNAQIGIHPNAPALTNISSASIRVQNNCQLYLGWQGATYNTTLRLNGVGWAPEMSLGTLRASTATLNGSVILETNSTIGSDTVFTLNAIISDEGGDFGFTKLAGGNLTLTAANTYDGDTIVNAGSLTLAENAQLKFTLGDASGISNRITGAGTVVLNGDFIIDTTAAEALPFGTWIIENVTTLTGAYAPTFKVIDWTDAGDDKWTKTVGLKTFTFNEITGSVTLSSGAPVITTLTWNVEGGEFWDTATANWTGDATVFTSNGTQDVVFDKSVGGIITIPASVNPKSTTVSATEGTYTFIGSAISGIGSLTKSGNGTLVLSSANTYVGATIVNSGILQISNSNQASTAFTIASGAMIEVNTTGAFPSVGSTLSGSGTLKMSRVGGLRFNMSDFTGVVEASNAQVGIHPSAPALTNISSTSIRVQNNCQLYLGWQGATYNTTLRLNGIGWTPEINLGALRASTATLNGSVILETNSTIGADNNFTINSVISDEGGDFGFTKLSGGNLTLTAANTYGGNTIVNVGTLTLADDAQLRFKLGNASGVSNSISGAGTLALNGDFVIDTTAADALASGTWTLENVSSLIGAYGSTFTVVDWTDAGSDKWTKTVGAKTYTFDETTGVVTLQGPGYGSWASVNGAGPNLNDDHDGDGVANGVEYLLGGTSGNTTGFTAMPGVTNTAGTLSVTWVMGAGYTGVYGTDFSVETSETLTGTWTSESIPGTVTVSGNNVIYSFPTPLGAKKFARLKVTGP